jgi:hypothetical protein
MLNFMSRRSKAANFGLLTLIAATVMPAHAASTPIHKVGALTWHAKKYSDQVVTVVGFVLVRDGSGVLFSDEPTGKVSMHDLPVTGPGVDQLRLAMKYVLQGRFVRDSSNGSNGNPYHLVLMAPPQQAIQP